MTTNSHPVRIRTLAPILAAVAAAILIAPVRSASSTDDVIADPSGTIDLPCRPADPRRTAYPWEQNIQRLPGSRRPSDTTTVDDAPVRNVEGRPDGWYEPPPAPTYRPVADGGPRIDARYL
jgi:hypothetical protein